MLNCRVCTAPIENYRSKGVTCGGECSLAWNVLRYHIDHEVDEKHRRSVAQCDLRNPNATPAKRRLARRILDGDVPPKNRTYYVPGSRAEYYARKFGLIPTPVEEPVRSA